MALTVARSTVWAPKVPIISKMLLYSNSCHMLQHVQQPCMSSSSVQNIASSNKDELYRQITVEVKGHDKAILNSYEKFTAMAAQELDVYIAKIYEPPRVIARMSLMKSVFVHKRHFHQYEMRTLYKVFEIKNITGSTANTFLEYIQRNLPEGMAMKVTKHQLEKFPDHIKPPSKKLSISHQENSTESTKSAEVVNCTQAKLTEQGENSKTDIDVDTKISKPDVSTSSLPTSKKDKKRTPKKTSEIKRNNEE